MSHPRPARTVRSGRVGVGADGDWLPSPDVAALDKCIAALPCPWSLFISVLIHTNRSMSHVKISVLMD